MGGIYKIILRDCIYSELQKSVSPAFSSMLGLTNNYLLPWNQEYKDENFIGVAEMSFLP